MMNYDLHSRIILRVPRFSVCRALTGMDEMLQDPVFREALYLASDSLYSELEKCDFDLSACNKKIRFALAKYQKRMCYRPTPFGTFAAMATVPLQREGEQGIVLKEASFNALVIQKHNTAQLNVCSAYRVNPFLYPYGNDFRVLTKTENGSQTTFSISELFGSELVKELVSIHGSFSHEYLEKLMHCKGIESAEINEYIRHLKELQIILQGQHQSQHFPVSLIPEKKNFSGSTYDSYCSVSVDGSMPSSLQRQIRQGIHCLEKISSRQNLPALSAFKAKFEKLFERRTVPLLHALDPELGIDYDGLSANANQIGQRGGAKVNWSPLHQLLLSKWTNQNGSGVPALELSDEDLASLDTIDKHYPPGMSIMFTSLGEKLLIKAAGGASSLNMIGRFTTLDPKILGIAEELASKEIKRNPDVLFAEMKHVDGPEVASVNRKNTVYDYQIPLFEDPDMDNDYLIDLKDLYLFLADNQLILWSGRLNKRIIPRFSNAYNYQRSTLPVFRFLCDLQHEGLDSNLNFSMAALFPGLSFYPRVVYKNVVLEAASWHLDAKDLIKLVGADPATQFARFIEYACRMNIPEEFYFEVHDHLLHIDGSCPEDVALLLQTITAAGKVVLREYFKGQESILKDQQGNEYTHEGIAFLTNKEISYPDVIRPPITYHESKNKLLPFDDWLYLKIYLHPAGYSDLLLSYIKPFIEEYLLNGNISSWFFISYYDDDFHLRIRVKQLDRRDYRLFKSYKRLTSKLRKVPNLMRLELATYFPEHERYAVIGVDKAEKLFRLSSKIVLSDLLKSKMAGNDEDNRVLIGLKHLWLVFHSLDLTLPEIETICHKISARISKNEKIKLDMEYREHQMLINQCVNNAATNNPDELEYLNLLSSIVSQLLIAETMNIVIDLNHMHLNRLYLYNQNSMEEKTYYFLEKMSRRFRSAAFSKPCRNLHM